VDTKEFGVFAPVGAVSLTVWRLTTHIWVVSHR